MSKSLYLLDGYSLIFRSYFAFIRNPLRNPEGRNSSAIFGFFRSLLMILRRRQPEYFAVVLDSTIPTFRHEQYDQYKATRDETPEDLNAQIPIIERILEDMLVPAIRVEGYEADDVIATLARRCASEGWSCYIISGDKDLLQLVDGKVRVLKPEQTGGFQEMGRDEVYDQWEVSPNQILDFLALIGDSIDNIPGVKGIGKKTAAKLLQQYEDLDGIYGNLERLSSRSWREKLEQGRESAYLSRRLVTLEMDVPIKQKLEDFRLPELDAAAAVPHLRKEGMNSLVRELQQAGGEAAESPPGGTASEEAGAASAATGSSGGAAAREGESGAGPGPGPGQDAGSGAGPGSGPGPGQGAGRGSGSGPGPGPGPEKGSPQAADPGEGLETADSVGADYRVVRDEADLKQLEKTIRDATWFAFDCETNSLDPMKAEPVGFSFSVAGGTGFYLPLRSPEQVAFSEDRVREWLGRILGDPALRVIGQNLKYDYKVLKRWGVDIAHVAFDTMVAAWLLDSIAGSYGLDVLARTYLGYKPISYRELIPKARRGEAELLFEEVPLEQAARYAAEDADVTFRLYERLAPALESGGLKRLFEEVEMPLVPLLAEMELEGIRLDTSVLSSFAEELEKQLSALEAEVFELCGKEFNLASTKQLQQVLFEERKLKPIRKTKTGYSTDTAVLQELAREDRVPDRVLRHRLLSKLKSTYVEALPRLVDRGTGRLHTHFNQTGTATGRLSSTEPNLQNIPIRDEEGRRIREAFVPDPGKLFVSADYAQIELVILAHLSGDPALSEAFREGEDVHRRTGALIFGVEPAEVSGEQRRIAKTINFGVMYGMSAYRLSRELGIPRSDAETFIERYFATYSHIKRFIEQTIHEAEETGLVRTLLGRERRLPDINNRNRSVKSGAERIAVNTPIQGSAADIVKMAMLAVSRRLRRERYEARLLLQVHDELILEAPEQEVPGVQALVREEMAGVVELSVPLRVSVEVGTSWGELH